MAISGVGQSYYQNNVATTKSTKSVNSTGETGNTKELSEAEEMAIFKKEFYAEIDKIPRNRTITNVAINISEEAFKNKDSFYDGLKGYLNHYYENRYELRNQPGSVREKSNDMLDKLQHMFGV